MARELIGLVLKDKWRIDSFLGEGGVAAVYAATHRNGKRVAVKILHEHLASLPEVRDRFLREGYVANRIDHPAAVQVLDDDTTDDGLVFLVMELLAGESADRRLQREGRLPPADVLALTDELLDVLVAAHAKGVLHRDLKPENVFLGRDGRLKLLDFGIARLQEPSAASSVLSNATQTGAAMGTPAYMPPEQARGRWDEVDARSDLWAVGATMFTLLTGRCVHEANTLNETLLRAMTQPASKLATALPEVPSAIAAVVDRALAFDRDARWPDAATMQHAVRDAIFAGPAALARTPLSAGALPGPQPTPVEARPRGTMLVGTVTPAPITPKATPPSGLLRSPLGIGAAATAGVLVVLGVVVVLATGRSRMEPSPVPSSLAAPAVAPGETARVQADSVTFAEPLPPVPAAPPDPSPIASAPGNATTQSPPRTLRPIVVPSASPYPLLSAHPASRPTSDPLMRRK
jgi:eukaryotic-like serine/threonine-protein kinase